MFKLLIPAVALLALAGAVAFWAYGQVDDGAQPGLEVIRWGNVTVSVPEGSGVVAVRDFAPAELKPPDGGQVLQLIEGESRLVIDADTGEVIFDSVKAEERAAIDQVLATLEITELDEDTAPWPYGSIPPHTPRERWGNISFTLPDRESGFTVFSEVGDGPEGGGYAIKLTNGRSTVSIDAVTGSVFEETTKIASEDREAVDRFLSTIQSAETRP